MLGRHLASCWHEGNADLDGEEAFSASIAGVQDGLLRGFTSIEVPPPANEEETHGHCQCHC